MLYRLLRTLDDDDELKTSHVDIPSKCYKLILFTKKLS